MHCCAHQVPSRTEQHNSTDHTDKGRRRGGEEVDKPGFVVCLAHIKHCNTSLKKKRDQDPAIFLPAHAECNSEVACRARAAHLYKHALSEAVLYCVPHKANTSLPAHPDNQLNSCKGAGACNHRWPAQKQGINTPLVLKFDAGRSVRTRARLARPAHEVATAHSSYLGRSQLRGCLINHLCLNCRGIPC